MKRRIVCFLAAILATATASISTPKPIYAHYDVDRIYQDIYIDLIDEAMSTILESSLQNDLTKERLYQGAMSGMLDVLGDPYSSYLTAEDFNNFLWLMDSEGYGIGMTLAETDDDNVIISSLVKDAPADRAGMLVGDILAGMDGYEFLGKGSDYVYEFISNHSDLAVTVTVLRMGEMLNFSLEKETILYPSVYVERLEDNSYLPDGVDTGDARYVYIESINSCTSDETAAMIESLKSEGVKKIILDLRDNTGGYLDQIEIICSQFVPNGVTFYIKDRYENTSTFTSELETLPFEKVVVLTNGYTASAAEIFAAALQDSQAAVIVGENTFGKGISQSLLEMDDGSGIILTEYEILRRSGEKLHGIGVIPDVYVREIPYFDSEVTYHNQGTITHLDEIKQILKDVGYDVGELNNIMDDMTLYTIRLVQNKYGLNQTGILDVETIDAINREVYKYNMRHDDILTKGLQLLFG